MAKGIVQIIQGGQYGSEAKGAIAAHLCVKENIDYAVRTGATNAGHTVIHNSESVKMQQLPVGFVNPHTYLVLGAGAMIDIDILAREVALIKRLTGNDVRSRLMIDYRAGIHYPVHAQRSKESGRHHAIGATGKGCSEAYIDKVQRRSELHKSARPRTVGEFQLDASYNVGDTEKVLNTAYDGGAKIQLEGTQGTLLDLHLGPYPYTTHKQTGPAQWMMEAGLSPALRTDIVMVLRTYPIRVAGNSGPLPQETSWPILARHMNSRLATFGHGPIVSESALCEFEDAVRFARSSFNAPEGSTGLDQHRWSAAERVEFKDALSELHATALRRMSHNGMAELSKLFELTTVTKKLRRVARMDFGDIRRATAQVRPHRVALTFLNYLFPEMWGSTVPITREEHFYIDSINTYGTGAPIAMFSRGPASEHIIEVP